MTAVIEAASAGVKDMADGSLRITFEFEPRFAAEAFALFGPRGRAVAVAALKDGAGAVGAPAQPGRELAPEPVRAVVEPKARREQGDLEMKAILWCKNPEFWKFLDKNVVGGVASENEAVQVVKESCCIESRRELDDSPEAKAYFLQHFVGPFYKWNLARGLV